MVYIFTKSWYPTHKATEVAKIYAEVMQQYPPDKSLGNIIVPVAARATKEGIESLIIVKPKEGKLKQEIRRIIEIMSHFNDIEGCEFAIDSRTWMRISKKKLKLKNFLPVNSNYCWQNARLTCLSSSNHY